MRDGVVSGRYHDGFPSVLHGLQAFGTPAWHHLDHIPVHIGGQPPSLCTTQASRTRVMDRLRPPLPCPSYLPWHCLSLGRGIAHRMARFATPTLACCAHEPQHQDIVLMLVRDARLHPSLRCLPHSWAQVKSVKVWEKAGGDHYLKGECSCDGSRSGDGSDQGKEFGRAGEGYETTFRFLALMTLVNSVVLLAMVVCWGMSSLRHSLPGYGREAGEYRKGPVRRQGGYQMASANLHVATGTEFGMPTRSSSRKPFANAMHF